RQPGERRPRRPRALQLGLPGAQPPGGVAALAKDPVEPLRPRLRPPRALAPGHHAVAGPAGVPPDATAAALAGVAHRGGVRAARALLPEHRLSAVRLPVQPRLPAVPCLAP